MDTHTSDNKEERIFKFKERQEAERSAELARQRAKGLKRLYILGVVFLLLAGIGFYTYTSITAAGAYDEFARCLGQKAVVYGNDACMYTQKQLSWFGNSAKYINYVKCIDNEQLCDQKGITITPTWEINGNLYPQVQSFDKLSTLTGCAIK